MDGQFYGPYLMVLVWSSDICATDTEVITAALKINNIYNSYTEAP